MVTRPLMPLGGGIVFFKLRMTSRPNLSFSPDRVMPGGRATADERPRGPLEALRVVALNGTRKSSCAGGLSS
jgi:hypothetical protein